MSETTSYGPSIASANFVDHYGCTPEELLACIREITGIAISPEGKLAFRLQFDVYRDLDNEVRGSELIDAARAMDESGEGEG